MASGESRGISQGRSPFHTGEHTIQERLGVRERLEEQGRRVIRDYLPAQHQEFYAHLPFVMVGTIDQTGHPWASLLVGRPGFISSPDPSTLTINARPIYGDPLNENVVPGADVGLLGIEFQSRRRNRLTGKVVTAGTATIALRVVQTFGNCPQYIQARDYELSPAIDRVGGELPVERLSTLSESAQTLITKADNFYIASQFSEDQAEASHGIDVSHRGGKAGFVRIDDAHTLTWPDFVGNFHFNTLGNLLLNPQAGLLFIDFDTQDLLYLTGTVEIIWDSDECRAFAGAQRLLRFSLLQAIQVSHAVPLTWRFQDYSPTLDQTGSWEEVAATLAARAQGNSYREYVVTRVEKESASITSFYLEPQGSEPLQCHTAGQFLPLELRPPGIAEPVRRTYTISDAPNGTYYRLSIKREPMGLASTYFHDSVMPGTTLRAMSPRGKFILETSSPRPLVLLSAGVGITPMLSMVNQLVNESVTCGCQRQVWFVHSARNGAEHAFGAHIRALATRCKTLHVHIRYSQPTESDHQGKAYDSQGHVDIPLLKSLLPFDDYDFYLCGPPAFIEAMYAGLKALNIADARLHYEFFGPGTSLQRERPSSVAVQPIPLDMEPVPVRFARAGLSVLWNPTNGTLLELAEAAGLRPSYSCRSGICQTCTTKLIAGSVAYREPPMSPPRTGEVLLCCAYPQSQQESGAGREGIVLDL